MFLTTKTAQRAPKHYLLVVAAVAGLACVAWTYAYMRFWFGWHDGQRTIAVSAIYGSGCGLGLLATLWIDHRAGVRWRTIRLRFILVAALAIILVCAFTAGLLAIQYRLYFAQWHAPFLSRPWMYQLFFTSLGAVAHYAIFGIRYHGLGSLIIILATCWWAMRTRH